MDIDRAPRRTRQRNMPKRGRHLGGDHARRVLVGGLLAAATLFGGLAATVPSGPVSATTEHCLNHETTPKVATGERNTVVLPAGTTFCVKGSTGATDTLTADGKTNLYDYLGNGHDVSYYVVYSRPQQPPPPPAPADPSKLGLTFIQECGVFTPLEGPWTAPADVQFRLRNENAAPVDYVLRQAGGGELQSGELAVGDTFVTFPFGARTLILETYNEAGTKVHSDTKAGGDTFLTTADEDAATKCLPTTPEPKIEFGDWVDGDYGCDDTTVGQTRVVTTTTYGWDGTKFVGTAVQTTETRTRDLDEVEATVCPTPTPEAPVAEPPVVDPPAQEPPTVDALPPAPTTPTQVAQLPPPEVVTATELPATGSSTWNTFLLALAALGAGTAFLRLSRRSA